MVTMRDGKKRVKILYDGTDQHPILARTYKVTIMVFLGMRTQG